MDEAAKLVNLSSGHFSRAFKITTGLTYSQYVIQARIELAKHLLQASSAPISEIALICGLSDQPSSWRRRAPDPPSGNRAEIINFQNPTNINKPSDAPDLK